DIVDDLHKVMSAVIRVRLLENYGHYRRGMPENYLYDIPQSWWSSAMAPDHEVGRQTFEDVLELLGNSKADRGLQANLILGWLPLEFGIEVSNQQAVRIQEKWLPILVEQWSDLLVQVEGTNTAEEKRTSDTLYEAYLWWINFAL